MGIVQKQKDPQVQAPKGCERAAAAFSALKDDMVNEKYAALLGALEADLLEGRMAFLPYSREDVAKMATTGLRLTVVKTPHGQMLAVFTSPEEASRQGADATVAVPLGVFFQTLMKQKEFEGLILNPLDRNGIMIARNHAQQVLENAGRRGNNRLDQPIVVDALWRLWDAAEGVPYPCRDVRGEVAALGGVDRLMGPVMADWRKRFEAGEFAEKDAHLVIKSMATDVLRYAMAAAALVKARPNLFDDKTPYEWLKEDVVEADGESLEEEIYLVLDGEDPTPEKVVKLRQAVTRNVDVYFGFLKEQLTKQNKRMKEVDLGRSMLANAGAVCFGAMSFGVGWGTALYDQSRGEEAVRIARDRQERLLMADEAKSSK